MLFTRCPGCQTTFRITADTLRVANGAVRCGSCGTVFSAFSGLRQDALSASMRQDDDFLSPTLQTQELAGIEEIAEPDLIRDEAETVEPEEQSAVSEIIVLETLAEDETDEPVAAQADTPPIELAPELGPEPEPESEPEPDSSKREEAVEYPPAAETVADESSGRLHFEPQVLHISQQL